MVDGTNYRIKVENFFQFLQVFNLTQNQVKVQNVMPIR